MSQLILGALVAITITGCQSLPNNKDNSKLVFLDNSDIQNIVTTAVDCQEQLYSKDATCPSPATAKHKINKHFKYGRFCGKGYPGFKHTSGKSEENLSVSEKRELALDYYRIRPTDDIDTVCQAHDVCWLLNPNNQLQCNENFEQAIHDIRQAMDRDLAKRKSWWPSTYVNTIQFRCSSLALDMEFASLTIFENKSDNKTSEIASSATRFFWAPITALYAFGYFLMSGMPSYPHENEWCSVAELERVAPKTSQANVQPNALEDTQQTARP